jgi:hypothetical protein
MSSARASAIARWAARASDRLGALRAALDECDARGASADDDDDATGGDTLLMIAAASGAAACVDFLLERGAGCKR